MSDYIPALITGAFATVAGPVFGIIKMQWDSYKEEKRFKKYLCYELSNTITIIKKDKFLDLSSDDDIKLLDLGAALHHIVQNNFSIVFRSNVSKIVFLNEKQFGLAIEVFNDVPFRIKNYADGPRDNGTNRDAKKWFREYLAKCEELHNSLKDDLKNIHTDHKFLSFFDTTI